MKTIPLNSEASSGVSEAAPELKPCPFCGGRALIKTRMPGLLENEDARRKSVECDSCGARTALVSASKTPTIAAWNARVHQPPVQNLEDRNSVSGASDYSTSRIPKDIQLTLAEIRERVSIVDSVTPELVAGDCYRDDVKSLLSIIDSLQRWQPIETAPTNIVSSGFSSDSGPRFLAWPVKGLVAGARWSESRSPSMTGGVVGVFVGDWNMQCKPTHWMPLPAAPITQADASASALSQNVPDESSVLHESKSSESESTLVTVDEAARRAAEKIWASLEGITYPDILEIIAIELSVHQPDVQGLVREIVNSEFGPSQEVHLAHKLDRVVDRIASALAASPVQRHVLSGFKCRICGSPLVLTHRNASLGQEYTVDETDPVYQVGVESPVQPEVSKEQQK